MLLRNDGALDQPSAATADAIPVPEAADSPSPSDFALGDADVGISQLSAITDPAARRDAALGLLDHRGYGSANIDEISAALPLIEVVSFKIDAIVKLGERDTQGALVAAMALREPEQRRLALRRLARVLAEHDPLGAAESIGDIDVPVLESEFISTLLDTWALTDPIRVFDYLEGADKARIPAADFAFETLAAHDPEQLLAIADQLEPAARAAAMTAALRSLIEKDPIAALPRIRQVALGADRAVLESEVARVYGEQDPEAAWLWANENQATAAMRLEVLAGIQKADPNLALDLVMTELASADINRREKMRQWIGSYLYYLSDSASSDDVRFALEQMLRFDDAVIEANVQQFIGHWSTRDAEAAIEWSLRNLDRIDPGQVLTSLGANLTRTNAERARQTVLLLPDQYRLPWVTGVGRALAESDLAAARAWAFEFPRGPLRDTALREYVRSEAHGGLVDVQIFEQFSDDAERGQAASQVAFGLSCDGHTELAREIASTHIASPELLAQTERQIEGNARRGAAIDNTNVFCEIGR